MSTSCLLCGGTGKLVDLSPCEACAKEKESKPLSGFVVPKAYANVSAFDKTFLPNGLQSDYGVFVEDVIREIETTKRYDRNLILCAPPNSGKSIFAYSVFNLLHSKGINYLPLMDIMEARDLLHGYTRDREALVLLESSPVCFFVIPLDIPTRFAETISTIVQRRVRKGGGTVFLFGGTKQDLMSVDTYKKLDRQVGDGSYTSILIKSFTKE